MGAQTSFLNHRKNLKISYFKIKSQFLCNNYFALRILRLLNKFFYKISVFGIAINRYENTVCFYSAAGDKKLYKNFAKDSVFCNFGSGAFSHSSWKNYDFPAITKKYKAIQGKENIDFFSINLCQENLKIPLDTSSVDLIYCSHTIEHLEEAKVINFLKECSRILKSGGVMRLSIPHTENNFYFSRLINQQKNTPQDLKDNSIKISAIEALSSAEDVNAEELINEIIDKNFSVENFYSSSSKKFELSKKFDDRKPERHISFWSHEKLSNIANNIGFKFYLPFYKGSSTSEPFKNIEVFDTTEPQWSLYGEFINN